MSLIAPPSPRMLQDGTVDPMERKKWEQKIAFFLNKAGSSTVSPGTIPAQSVYATTVPVTGATPGHDVIVTPFSTIQPNLIWSGYVSAPNVVTLRIANPTAGNIAVTAGTWTVRVLP